MRVLGLPPQLFAHPTPRQRTRRPALAPCPPQTAPNPLPTPSNPLSPLVCSEWKQELWQLQREWCGADRRSTAHMTGANVTAPAAACTPQAILASPNNLPTPSTPSPPLPAVNGNQNLGSLNGNGGWGAVGRGLAPGHPPALFFEAARSCKPVRTTSNPPRIPSHPCAANGNLNAGSFNGNGAGWCCVGARGAGAGGAAHAGAASCSPPTVWAHPAT